MTTENNEPEGNQASGKPPEQTPPQRPNGTPAIPIATNDEGIASVTSSQPGNGNREPSTDDSKEWRPAERWQVGISGALAVIALGAAVIYYGQFCQMRDATQTAAENFRLQTKALKLDERAWVAADQFDGKPEINKPYLINISAKNTGKTFAYRYEMVTIVTSKELADPDPDFVAEEEKWIKGHATVNGGLLAPNQEHYETVDVYGGKIDEMQWNYINSPTVIFLVFGRIKYWDIFGCDHWTTFCYRCLPSGQFATYGTYNNADENTCPETKKRL